MTRLDLLLGGFLTGCRGTEDQLEGEKKKNDSWLELRRGMRKQIQCTGLLFVGVRKVEMRGRFCNVFCFCKADTARWENSAAFAFLGLS
jgi:hypothetical protein